MEALRKGIRKISNPYTKVLLLEEYGKKPFGIKKTQLIQVKNILVF